MTDVPQEVYDDVVQLRRCSKALLCALRACEDSDNGGDAARARSVYTLLWHEWLHLGQELQRWLLAHTDVPPVTPLPGNMTAAAKNDDDAVHTSASAAPQPQQHRTAAIAAAVPLHGLLYLPDDAAVTLRTTPPRLLLPRDGDGRDDASVCSRSHSNDALVATSPTLPTRRGASHRRAHYADTYDVHVWWPRDSGSDDDDDAMPVRVHVTSSCRTVADVVARAYAAATTATRRRVPASACLYTPTGRVVQSVCELAANGHYLVVDHGRAYDRNAVPTRLLSTLVHTAQRVRQHT